MADAWLTLLLEPIRAARTATREAADDAFASILTSMRVEAIQNNHCGTCDQYDRRAT